MAESARPYELVEPRVERVFGLGDLRFFGFEFGAEIGHAVRVMGARKREIESLSFSASFIKLHEIAERRPLLVEEDMQAPPERGLHVVGEVHAPCPYHLSQGVDQLVGEVSLISRARRDVSEGETPEMRRGLMQGARPRSRS